MLKELEKWLAGAETLRAEAAQADRLEVRLLRLSEERAQLETEFKLERDRAIQTKRKLAEMQASDQQRAQQIEAFKASEAKLQAQVVELTRRLEGIESTPEAKAKREEERKTLLAKLEAEIAAKQAELAKVKSQN